MYVKSKKSLIYSRLYGPTRFLLSNSSQGLKMSLGRIQQRRESSLRKVVTEVMDSMRGVYGLAWRSSRLPTKHHNMTSNQHELTLVQG